MSHRYVFLPVALVVVGLTFAVTVPAQVRTVYDEGSNALIRELQRMQTIASVLHTGAHPDDEDSALVAYHARGEHARTAYLSLTRGSGGQNIIGTEQSDLLGVIRTEELLQARRLDGAEQLFTRANDFGFSKQRFEASRLWDEEAILGDMVLALRTFRPTVVVSRWSGTPADGHGHHQFAGYLTPLAIEAAADPARFPEQIAGGLRAWRPLKFYVMERIGNVSADSPSLVVNTGAHDPVTGRSYFEIGMHGRSQQKTQQMGSLEFRGRQYSGLKLMESGSAAGKIENSVFDGVDTSITGIAKFESGNDAEFLRLLARLESEAAEALSAYRPLEPEKLIPVLSEGLEFARAARDAATNPDARRLLTDKAQQFEQALFLASGVTIDALANRETVVPGSTFQVAIRLYDPEQAEIAFHNVKLKLPNGWSATTSTATLLSNEENNRRNDAADIQRVFDIRLPPGAELSQPYWLRRPAEAFTYDWRDAQGAENQPFEPPTVSADIELDIGAAKITVKREVQFRFVDRVRGEIRRRLDVVPLISVEPATDLIVLPQSAGSKRQEIKLTVRNNSATDVLGKAYFEIPGDWAINPAAIDFSLAPDPSSTTLAFAVELPSDLAAGQYQFRGVAEIAGTPYKQTMHEIAYPHISSHRIYREAVTQFRVIDVNVAPVKVGYIMGSGDNVPDAMRLLGLNVTLLDAAALTTGGLDDYEVIVVGIRASQTRPDFVANNRRLLDFAESGGTLIVQYQQPDFIAQGLAPFDASMDGNVRVVDETAPVEILVKNHPVFNYPNQIDSTDFNGWVQERNNYNFTSFDRDHYVPLTESHDPGEPKSDGAMVYAKIGNGHYVYTSYSWFRQLPRGVPGAYRLFANLLSLPQSSGDITTE